MTKNEILENLKKQMYEHYRAAECFEKYHGGEGRGSALNYANCVFHTGRALLGYCPQWRDRLENARVEAREQAEREYRD